MIPNMIPLKIFLYHGTNTKIACPKWNMGYTGRDFGQCFYTTYDRNTAKIWAVKNFKENAIVNKYTINLEKLNDGGLKIKRFYANAEWAEFVWRNRYDIHFKRPNYDIIIGPIADKDLKQQFIKRKTEGLSFAQVANLIHYDKFHSLQVCFCSDYALSMLEI